MRAPWSLAALLASPRLWILPHESGDARLLEPHRLPPDGNLVGFWSNESTDLARPHALHVCHYALHVGDYVVLAHE